MVKLGNNRYGVEMYLWKLEAKLLSKRNVTKSNCWEWLGGKDDKGYGRVCWQGKILRVHQFAFWLWKMHGKGKIGRWKIRHKECDNPICFNPAHLKRGTQKQNMQDCIKRGRKPTGSSCVHAVLTEKKVRSIRRLFAKGVSQAELSRRFKANNVWGIVRSKIWKGA
jgi:hypothetical protein